MSRAPGPRRRAVARATAAIAAVACVTALLSAPRASAWKWVFNDFFAAQGAGVGAAQAVAKKCNGGKLGYYNFRSIATGSGGDSELTVDVRLDLPVFPKWKRFRDVNVSIQATQDFDPSMIAAITASYTDFWEGGKSKWEPGELSFKHPELVVFGAEILSEGVHKEDFKPKDKC